MASARLVVLAFAAVVVTASLAAQEVRPDHLREGGAVLSPAVVPAPFRGHWSVDRHDCGADPVDESQVWIAAASLNSYKTNGHVVRVVTQRGRRAVLTLRSEGEGTTFIARKGLTLSPDRTTLVIRDEDDTGSTTFHRCPPRPSDARR
jgi:uncharacterized protein (DUF779 family)